MARRPSVGEAALGMIVLALVGFVVSQLFATPRRPRTQATRVLSARDSASIAEQYRSQVAYRASAYRAPEWLAQVHVARLQAAAALDVAAERQAQAAHVDSIRAVLTDPSRGYLHDMLAEDRNVVTRWRPSGDAIRVWVQSYAPDAGLTAEMIAPARRGFTAWNEVTSELALGVWFEIVDDSTDADVHVTWSAAMPRSMQIGTTFRMTGGAGWIALSHVVLSTAHDVYTVQNVARHEAGHVLGLGHSPDVRDIMAAATEGRQYQLTDADRRTLALLYRLPVGKLP
jgi:hypothetical protein